MKCEGNIRHIYRSILDSIQKQRRKFKMYCDTKKILKNHDEIEGYGQKHSYKKLEIL
jgi:hypothetical protein